MSVLEDFKAFSASSDVSSAVAAIRALTRMLQRSTASTMMSLVVEIRSAADDLTSYGEYSISLKAGCDLFLNDVTRTFDDGRDFESCKRAIVERGERFMEKAVESRETIATHGERFIRDDATILIHGHSRVVTQVLLNAAKSKTFNVIITESRGVVGDGDGYVTAGILTKHSIPCTVILDSAVAYTMGKVDMCLVGASGVVENGGIVNKVGTYQLAVVANAFRKPLYVAAESYKFARLYPLNQDDLPSSKNQHAIVPCLDFGKSLQSENSELLQMTSPTSDYTPPSYITLLFTDLGVLTTAAVSDELIKLYS